ncbi:MAG: hypothetical protein GQF41_2535 [Candidatus Rifleibacterium amylolyticum]|nr:MAG: hypothetical protein GQF41_2535 [Candidatus Rifleibacterium amylolyticum]
MKTEKVLQSRTNSQTSLKESAGRSCFIVQLGDSEDMFACKAVYNREFN